MVRPEAGQHVDRVGDGWRVRMQGPEEVGVADRGRALVVQDGVASDRPIRPRRGGDVHQQGFAEGPGGQRGSVCADQGGGQAGVYGSAGAGDTLSNLLYAMVFQTLFFS